MHQLDLPRYLIKHYVSACQWVCFWMRCVHILDDACSSQWAIPMWADMIWVCQGLKTARSREKLVSYTLPLRSRNINLLLSGPPWSQAPDSDWHLHPPQPHPLPFNYTTGFSSLHLTCTHCGMTLKFTLNPYSSVLI